MFIALKACIDGFLNGCRPYLGVDSTILTGRWRGQLVCAVGIDGHNWMFPVAYGVFGSESLDSWKWFMEMLEKAIGSPKGLVISTDAGKGIDGAVTAVFTNGVEHRECMRHLLKNLWPASRAYRKDVFDRHFNIMKEASSRAIFGLLKITSICGLDQPFPLIANVIMLPTTLQRLSIVG